MSCATCSRIFDLLKRKKICQGCGKHLCSNCATRTDKIFSKTRLETFVSFRVCSKCQIILDGNITHAILMAWSLQDLQDFISHQKIPVVGEGKDCLVDLIMHHFASDNPNEIRHRNHQEHFGETVICEDASNETRGNSPTRGFQRYNGPDIEAYVPTRPRTPFSIPGDTLRLEVRRPCLIHDMLKAFQKTAVLKKHVKIKVADEEAADEGGVFRDVICDFWKKLFERYFRGEDIYYPVIQPELQAEDFKAIGRIIVCAYVQERYFPIRVARSCVKSMLFGTASLPTCQLRECFMLSCSSLEREMFNKAAELESFDDKLQEDLVDFFSRYQVRVLPSPLNLQDLISRVAALEIIEKPSFGLKHMASSVKMLKEFEDFSSAENVDYLYEKLKPKAGAVSQQLISLPHTRTEMTVRDYLARFVVSLKLDMLAVFLRFCTGSDLYTGPINVAFVDTTGLKRRFVAHTCGPVLEVPVSYNSYNEFESEFKNQLNNISWEMHIV